MSNEKRNPREFTDEFKKQIVQLYLNGKSKSEIQKEYDLYASTPDRWIKQNQETGSFKTKDNLTEEQKELLELRKRNKQLKMENGIMFV